jgi:hypothetical protein
MASTIPTKKANKKHTLEADDACGLMHTALRKCCDSKITSAAYHLIQMIHVRPEIWDPWILLGKIVAKRINESGNKPLEALKVAAGHLNEAWLDICDKERTAGREPPSGARNALYALTCILELFSEEDLVGMSSYLED